MKIYRDVVVKGNKIIWMNPQMFSSVEGAMAALTKRAEDAVEFLGCRIEELNRHPFELCELKEGLHTVFLTVDFKKVVVTDELNRSILGYVVYELK